MATNDINPTSGPRNRRNFGTPERAAIWQAYQMRCAYTGDPVPFGTLQIDHIVPISINQPDLECLIARGLIPSTFDLNGLENLVPTSSYQNGSKQDRVRGDNALIHFLDVAAAARPKIEKILMQNAASDRSLKGYLLLKTQAEQNDLDIDEVIDIKRQEVDGWTRVTSSPDVDEGAGVTLVNATLASELLGKRLAIGGGDIHSVTVQNDLGDKRICTTCSEFLKAKDDGYWPLTQFDMNCFGMADRTCETLRAITKARYAPASVIRFPRVDCDDLDRWSSQWVISAFMGKSEDASNVLAEHPTIMSLIDAGHCVLTTRSKNAFEVTANGMAVRISEMFRADVDGDGEEEIVVFHLLYATGGTLCAGGVCVAKPNSADGILHSADITGESE